MIKMSVPLTFSEALNVSAMTAIVVRNDDDGSWGIRSVPTESFYDFQRSPMFGVGSNRVLGMAFWLLQPSSGEMFSCKLTCYYEYAMAT